jgi:S-adenosyl-L-methionine hydrolase (adenosine-forming)
VSGSTITLTTDFGTASPYVAAMKGVLLSVNPNARLVDLTHEVPPQNVAYAGFFLAGALPYFPKSAVHLVVVDPGVGTDRNILCVDLGGCQLVGPDNGFWSALSQKLDLEPSVYRVDCLRCQLSIVSHTFHGRDKMAPAAARLSLGHPPQSLGERTKEWCELEQDFPSVVGSEVHGKVIFIDGFGNLITNIASIDIQKIDTPFEVEIAGKTVRQIVRTYADAAPGTPLALLSSFNLLEIAICQGSAELFFSAGVGACVVLRRRKLQS